MSEIVNLLNETIEKSQNEFEHWTGKLCGILKKLGVSSLTLIGDWTKIRIDTKEKFIEVMSYNEEKNDWNLVEKIKIDCEIDSELEISYDIIQMAIEFKKGNNIVTVKFDSVLYEKIGSKIKRLEKKIIGIEEIVNNKILSNYLVIKELQGWLDS